MKINKSTLPLNKPVAFSDDISFDSSNFDPLHVRGINKCHVVALATLYEDVLKIDVDVTAEVVGVCAYSLEDVLVPIKAKDELVFTEDENDDVNFYEPGNLIDLDEYILGLVLSYVPSKVIKKGAIRPQDGEGYRVISEDEYNEEKASKKDPRWAKLDDIEL